MRTSWGELAGYAGLFPFNAFNVSLGVPQVQKMLFYPVLVEGFEKNTNIRNLVDLL